MTTTIQGNSNTNPGADLGICLAGTGNTSDKSGFIVQYTRQQVANAINAAQIVQWRFTGTKGSAIAGCCAVAEGNSIIFVGLIEDYLGFTPNLVVHGNYGLSFLSATYVGTEQTVTLPGST